MTYTYTCNNCKDSKELALSFKDTLPSELICSKCSGIMKHNFIMDVSSTITKIPDHFKALKLDKELNYTKIPRDKRRFY